MGTMEERQTHRAIVEMARSLNRIADALERLADSPNMKRATEEMLAGYVRDPETGRLSNTGRFTDSEVT